MAQSSVRIVTDLHDEPHIDGRRVTVCRIQGLVEGAGEIGRSSGRTARSRRDRGVRRAPILPRPPRRDGRGRAPASGAGVRTRCRRGVAVGTERGYRRLTGWSTASSSTRTRVRESRKRSAEKRLPQNTSTASSLRELTTIRSRRSPGRTATSYSLTTPIFSIGRFVTTFRSCTTRTTRWICTRSRTASRR